MTCLTCLQSSLVLPFAWVVGSGQLEQFTSLDTRGHETLSSKQFPLSVVACPAMSSGHMDEFSVCLNHAR